VSAVLSIDSNLSADNTSISASMSSSGGLSSSVIGAVHTSLTNLRNVLNCVNNIGGCTLTGTHVVKRISVAVVLDPTRAGVGPRKAIWMSSLVTDPSDGLL
jgi:phosphotransacetylase